MKKNISIFLILFLSSILCKAQNPWIIEAEEINPVNYYGISVSNGMIGIVSSPEPLKVKEVILAGVYDKYGRGRTSNFLPSFNALDINISLGWEDINISNISNYKQWLDMKTGTFSASFDFKDIARIEYSYMALRHLPYNSLMEVKVTPLKNTHLVAENILRDPLSLKDSHHYYNEINPSHAYIPLLTSVAKSPSGNTNIVASNTFLFQEKHGDEPRVLHEMRDNDAHSMKFIKELIKGEPYTFSLVGTLVSTEHFQDAYNQAERLSVYANLQGADKLISDHKKEWEYLWLSDIIIEGDPLAQQQIHNMMYHLYSFTRTGTGYSLSPMGLSGLGYNGHVFWDTEIFMYPPLLILHPELAKELIEYRFKRLDAAKRNAMSYGYKGAMFPWESATSGEEETPIWALSGTYEHHITGDVAFATYYYYLISQDKEWLKTRGWPIIKSTAEFWESRVTQNDKGIYEILNVVCADEWAENVNNNAYTNAIAKLNFEHANKCAEILGLPINKHWAEIADNLIFSQMENGVTREHDSYIGQNIKQADVNLLAYPLKVITDKKQILKDLKYYQTKVPQKDTPAMTQAIFALLHSRLGDSKEAYKWFEDSFRPNLLPPFGVMAETKGGTNPYFITGAGGVLQSVIMGFAGLEIQEDGSMQQLESVLPDHWKRITIQNIGVNKDTITKENLNYKKEERTCCTKAVQ